MAFTPIDPVDIEVGKPVKKKLFQSTKDNFDDLNTRTGALESGAAKIELFISEIVNLQQYENGGDLLRVMMVRASRNMTITNAQIYVLSSSTGSLPTGGTLEFDIRKGNDPSSLSTIFNTKPSTTGLTEGSTNASVDFIVGGNVVNQGQWLAFDITSLQTNQSRIFIDIFAEPV